MNRKFLEKLVFWLEECIKIPFTKWRIGLDGLIGLLPAVGDTVMLLVSGVFIVYAIKQKVGPKVFWKMVKNILIDYLIGFIPVIGDLFDFKWKANKKNLKLLMDHLEEKEKNITP